MDALEVTYRCTRADYLRHTFRQRRRALLGFLALLAIVSMVVLVFVQAVSRPGGVALWLIVAGLPMFYGAVLLLGLVRMLHAIGRHPELFPPEPWTLRLAPSGVVLTAGALRHELPWSSLTDVVLTRRDVLLVHRSGSLPVPRRELADAVALYAALREGVDSASTEDEPGPPAGGEGTFGPIAYTLTEAHWVEAFHVLERSGPRLLLWLAVGTLSAALAAVTGVIVNRIVAGLVEGGAPATDDLIVVTLGALLCVAMPLWLFSRPVLRRRRLRGRIRKGELHIGEAWLSWTDEGIRVTTRSATRIPWATLHAVARSDTLACLRLGSRAVIPVPLEALGAEADAVIERWRLRIRDARSAGTPAAPGAPPDGQPFAPPR